MVQLAEDTAEEVKDPIKTTKDTRVRQSKKSGGMIWGHNNYLQSQREHSRKEDIT